MKPECYELRVITADGREIVHYYDTRDEAELLAYGNLKMGAAAVRIEPLDHLPYQVAKSPCVPPAWISVRDRLPPDEDSKFVRYADGFITTARSLKDFGWYPPRGRVTHWMPFPGPPIVEELNKT